MGELGLLINLFGKLPICIVATIGLAIYIWYKFLSTKETSKIKKFEDITAIFIFFIFSLLGFATIIQFSDIISNNVGGAAIFFSQINYFIFVIAIVGIFAMIFLSDKFNLNLKKVFIYCIRINIFFTIIYLGFFILMLPTTLILTQASSILIVIFTMVFLIIIAIPKIVGTYFKMDLLAEVCDEKWKKIAGLTLLFVFILGLFFIPFFSIEDATLTEYNMYDLKQGAPEKIYSKIRIPVSIHTFAVFVSSMPNIPIYYGPHNISMDDIGNKNLKILLNTSRGLKILTDKDKYNFKELIKDEKEKLIILKYDERNIKKEGINQIILEGLIKTSITENEFSYWDNHLHPEVCTKTGCSLVINITNNLDLPLIYEGRETILNFQHFNLINRSNCKFIDFTINQIENIANISTDVSYCDENNCEIVIRDLNGKKNIFELDLFLIDREIVQIKKIYSKKPIDISTTFDISCI